MPKKILIDFEKIKDPYSGLGQFLFHLKSFFDQSELNLKYFIPNKLTKLSKHSSLFLPSCDVFHAIHQDSPYLPPKNAKYVLTIHDLNALSELNDNKKKNKFRKLLQQRIDRADFITYISEYTKRDVETNFDIKNKPSKIIYNGIALTSDIDEPKIKSDKPFIFTIGTVLPKKNFHVLVDLMKEISDFNLIIAGPKESTYAKEIEQRIINENLGDKIFLVGKISDANKNWYYKNASAFIFPSLLEGFGLPVAEAMSFGLPLFLSKATSIPEIGGNDAYYFENFNPKEMSVVLKNGMNNFTNEKKLKLMERSKIFDFKKAANEYLEIYNRL